MTLYLAFFEFYNFYYTADDKLNELGYTEPGKWAVKWLIKNILLTTYIFCQFHLQRHISHEPLLKISMIGIALTAAWLPCAKAFPLLSVMLMCFKTFFLVIGPLHSIPIFIRNLRYDSLVRGSLEYLYIHNIFIIYIVAPLIIHRGKREDPHDWTIYQCLFAWCLLLCLVFDEIKAHLERNRLREERAEVEELQRYRLAIA